MNKQQSISNNPIENPEKWVDLYGDYLYGYAFYRVYEATVAEDLVQETFLAALRSFKNFQYRSSIKTWLTGILKNKIMDFFRKRYRELPSSQDVIERVVMDDFFDERDNWAIKPRKWQENPQHIHERKEFMSVLMKCLSTISKKQADAFRLREINQVDTDEICKVLKISATNYWVLMHRARLQIRKCLEMQWFLSKPEGDKS